MTDLLLGVITCDMMRRTIDIVEAEAGIPVFRVNMPATRSANAESYFVMEVKRAVEELGRFLHRKFDAAKCISYFNARQKISEILEDFVIGDKVPPVLTHKLFHIFSIARPEEMLGFLRNLKLKKSSKAGCVKIVLTGSALCLEDVYLTQLLQEKGVAVIPFSCTGLGATEIYKSDNLVKFGLKRDCMGLDGTSPSWWHIEDTLKQKVPASCRRSMNSAGKYDLMKVRNNDFIEVLALLSFNSNICIRQRPNIAVYDRLKEIIRSEECDGVILKSLKFCDLWFTEKERMKQELGVPLLVLDTTYSDSEHERIRNRVEAFLEILDLLGGSLSAQANP
jgi:benzoyl-CoA reductase/2-hydroxyglutaryl-CoA dehydratase subunit BcrC/BadD/HgdB